MKNLLIIFIETIKKILCWHPSIEQQELIFGIIVIIAMILIPIAFIYRSKSIGKRWDDRTKYQS